MRFHLQHFLALGLCLVNVCLTSHISDFEARQQKIYTRISHLLRTNETYAAEYRKWALTQAQVSDHKFPCKHLAPSPEVPTSVHKLRPADVKVIAALGDSLTAGRDAERGIFGVLSDFRGKSWSIGGDQEFSKFRSLPNILRLFNKDIKGFSLGMGDRSRNFNGAVSGAISEDTLGQAKWLVDQLKKSKDVDFKNDWKVITFFIGGNDLCAFCEDKEKYSVESFEKNVQASLDYLHENVPRAFVNLVNIMHVEIVKDIRSNLFCDAVHLYACQCASYPCEKQEKELVALRDGYHAAIKKLDASGRYDTRDDFAVVLQPFYDNTFPPKLETGKVDMSFFAADCFHYSKRGQEAAAKALWNNMIEPVGAKRLDWTPHEPTECPTKKHPYFFTKKNSVNATG